MDMRKLTGPKESLQTALTVVMLMFLMVLANTSATATTEDSVVNQLDTNHQIKYITYSRYLPFQAAHPPLLYHQLPGMPLPLKYHMPAYHVPGVAIPGAPPASPASTVFIQRLMHPSTAVPVPVADISHIVTTPDDVQFAAAGVDPEVKTDSLEVCRKLASKCLSIDLMYRDLMVGVGDQPLTYARNPVHLPIPLEEDGMPATYGPLLFCGMFALKCITNPQVLLLIPNAIGQIGPIVCQAFGATITGLIPGFPIPC